MSIVYDKFGVTVHQGDCLNVLTSMPDASVHAVVTDPPYGLEFMGKEWDSFRPSSARLRTRVDGRTNPRNGKSVVTTPEAYVAGHPFQQWCEQWARECLRVLTPGGHLLAFGGTRTWHRLACAVEDAGFQVRDSVAWLYASGFPKSHNLGGNWSGWGTALKPAFEPIVVGRKPLSGTVAATVAEHSTGALHIDACRTPAGQDYRDKCASVVGLDSNRNGDAYGEWAGSRVDSAHEGGRWPANVVLDEHVAADLGNASRFFPAFHWQAKAPSAERPRVDGVAHPTVKPLALMRWLVRLVSPPGGVVLDPFLGSGTTAQAARAEGFQCVGIERDPAYVELIRARLGEGSGLFGEDGAA